MTRLEELIDTAAYPLHHAEGRAALVGAARRSLAEGGFVRLPGFVLPAAVQAMAREAERACDAGGFRRDYLLGAYGGKGEPDLPSATVCSRYASAFWMVCAARPRASGTTLLE